MIRSNTNHHGGVIVSFVCGVVTTASIMYLVRKMQQQRQQCCHDMEVESKEQLNQKQNKTNPIAERNSDTTNDTTIPKDIDSNDLFDSPELDLRLLRKAEAVIQGRTSSLCIIIERCTNDHNYSAILRTAEALGVQHIHIIDKPPLTDGAGNIVTTNSNSVSDNNDSDGVDDVLEEEEEEDEDDDNDTNIEENESSRIPAKSSTTTKSNGNKKNNKIAIPKLSCEEIQQRNSHRLFAQNATEWLTIHEYTSTTECIQACRQLGYAIWVTDLSQKAVKLTEHDLQQCQQQQQNENKQPQPQQVWPLPNKLAICMGTEAVGASDELLNLADLRVYLPLVGFADSLNLSVATAMVVQLLFHYGPYDGIMEEEERYQLRQLWYPKLASQRLLSSREKKRHKQLKKSINYCHQLQQKKEKYRQEANGLSLLTDHNGNSNNTEEGSLRCLTKDQEDKILKLPQLLQELQRLEEKKNVSATIVQDLIENPPQPICDLRRSDPHRITFAGKKTKKLHSDHWKNMPATTRYQTPTMSTAHYFRQLLTMNQRSS